MQILDGKQVSQDIKTKIANYVTNNYVAKGEKAPTLACVLVGDDPASKIYVANKEKACAFCGINSKVIKLPENSTNKQVERVIKELNADKNVSAILLQLPLPKQLDEKNLVNLISPAKDADGLTELNLGKLMSSNHKIAPCTATGIIDILDYYKLPIQGKRAVVVGRSLLVGKSVANLLEQRNATVTICHSKTVDLAKITKQADILVVAIGKPNYITANMVKQDAIVVDVGINRLSNGSMVGDVEFPSVKNKASYITPVPGGVGPMTIAELMKNTILLHNEQQKQNIESNEK